METLLLPLLLLPADQLLLGTEGGQVLRCQDQQLSYSILTDANLAGRVNARAGCRPGALFMLGVHCAGVGPGPRARRPACGSPATRGTRARCTPWTLAPLPGTSTSVQG